MNIAERMEREKIIAIVRGTFGEELLRLARALYDGGIKFLEVTFVQNAAGCIGATTEAIRMLTSELPEDVCIGAGTVMNREQVDAAKDAGARYIISPNVNFEVIRRTRELGLVSIPGAMTPSEIASAHDCGADMVKLFPWANLGSAYVKNIRAPLSHIKLVATAGINEGNFSEVLESGFSAAGISGRLTDRKLIAAGNFAEITRRAQAFVDIARRYQ